MPKVSTHKETIIRSSVVSLKFANQQKQAELHDFIDEYRRICTQFVDMLWDKEDLKSYVTTDEYKSIDSWLSARMRCNAGKQVIGVIKGTKQKQKQRAYRIGKLREEGKHENADRLQKTFDKNSYSKPDVSRINPELDSKFVKFDMDNSTSFDGWVGFKSIGNNIKTKIPFKKTSHFNSMADKGSMRNSILLSKNDMTFRFSLPVEQKDSKGKTLGIDIGLKTVLTCSDKQTSESDIHNHTLQSIINKMSRQTKGSKAFRRSQAHRDNHIGWAVNRLNLTNTSLVKLENIKDMRRHRRTNRELGHWAYPAILAKLESKCERQGVPVIRISPTYTSKRCSSCGWTKRGNRKGKMFDCDSCGNAIDADYNASLNIAAPLRAIAFKGRRQYNIETGFHWTVGGEGFRVPPVQKEK